LSMLREQVRVQFPGRGPNAQQENSPAVACAACFVAPGLFPFERHAVVRFASRDTHSTAIGRRRYNQPRPRRLAYPSETLSMKLAFSTNAYLKFSFAEA